MYNSDSFLKLLQIDYEKYPVIAVVGGGGKTSLIYRLTKELVNLGKKVIIATTTHMAYDLDAPFAPDGEEGILKEKLQEYGYAVAAKLEKESGKFASLEGGRLEKLKDQCDVLLIEADGAKQKPIKVPEEWEPVIPAFADLVISVIGLDCLGKPICQTAHRMERTSSFLSKSLDAPITPEDIVKIATSICGLYKNVEDRVYRVYLNKSDVLKEDTCAKEIVQKLTRSDTVAAYGSLKEAQKI